MKGKMFLRIGMAGAALLGLAIYAAARKAGGQHAGHEEKVKRQELLVANNMQLTIGSQGFLARL